MNQSFNQVDWSTTNILRAIGIILQVVWLLELVMLLSHYRFRMLPLVRQIKDKTAGMLIVLNFCFQVGVALYVVVNILTGAQRLVINSSATISTYSIPPITSAMIVITYLFEQAYSNLLDRDWGDRNSLKRSDLSTEPKRP